MTNERPLLSARAVALAALYRVDDQGAYANLALDDLLRRSKLSPRDRGFATELTYGTLRWRGRIDWVLSHFLSKPLTAQHPRVRNILRLGAYQLLFLPNIPPHAAVNEAVALAKSVPDTRKAAAFVNAVLRKVAAEGAKLSLPPAETDPVRRVAIETSHPEWMVQRWAGQYGLERILPFLEANNDPAPLSVRTNTLRTSVDALARHLEEEGVKAVRSSLLPVSLRLEGAAGLSHLGAFRAGLFTAQDEGSQLVAYAVGARPGQVVWDVCSAPGTKTTHLAELMGDRGRIIAVDIHPERLGLVKEACARLGINSVQAVVGDARTPDGEPMSADAVLVDAPCSGVGVLRRRPDLRWQRQPDDFDDLIRLQRAILRGAAGLVREGGVLVYSTCSVDAEENLENVRWFLAHHETFRLDSLVPHFPQEFVASLSEERQREAESGYLQLWPHLDGTDGFFVARFVRDKSQRVS